MEGEVKPVFSCCSGGQLWEDVRLRAHAADVQNCPFNLNKWNQEGFVWKGYKIANIFCLQCHFLSFFYPIMRNINTGLFTVNFNSWFVLPAGPFLDDAEERKRREICSNFFCLFFCDE